MIESPFRRIEMKREIAQHLLDIKAVFLRPNEPFTWVSGIKSPIYCDNRLTLSYPEIRKDIENGLVSIIREHYPDCEAIFGTSTAGIPHAAIVADIMNLPMGYVRGNTKDHGRNNQIEGRFEKDWKVVVIEDLISTAGSVVEVVQILRENGCNVLGIASIFTYGMQSGLDNLRKAQVQNYSLTDFDTLIEVELENGSLSRADVNKLYPSDSSWQFCTSAVENPQIY